MSQINDFINEGPPGNIDLSKNRERFRALVTASSDVVFRLSPDWQEIRFLKNDEFLADPCHPTVSWLERYTLVEDRAGVLAAIEEARRKKRTFKLEHRVLRSDGSLGWSLSRAVPLLDETGEVLEWIGTGTDVTSQKEAEAALRQGRELTEAVNRISAVLHSTLDTDEVIRRIVDEGVVALGSDTAAISERDEGGWKVRYVHGLPREMVGARLEDEREKHAVLALKTGEVVAVEDAFTDERFNRQHLRQHNIKSVLVAPLICHGNPFGVIFFNYHGSRHWFSAAETNFAKQLAAAASSGLENARLFEERQQVEMALMQERERLRLALEGARAGSWETDLQTGQMRWGQGMSKLLGLSPERAEIEKERWTQYIHPEDRQRMLARFLDAAKNPGAGWNEEFRVTKLDGTVAWLASQGTCFESPDGQRRMLGVSLDITSRKAAEEVLRRSTEELELLVRERTARLQEVVHELEHFSYTITHDMRAPLRVMRGVAEIVNEPGNNWSVDEQERLLRRIIVAADRMDALITDALNYSRAVQQELPLARIDVGLLLRGMLETYPEFQDDNVSIYLEEKLPIVMANKAGLTQCFSNLLGNAVKFTKPGEKSKVKVYSELVTEENRSGWVRLWVADNGIGISEWMKPRVFEMFSRGAHAQAGTGIGLALVRKVVDRMGGLVGFESREGDGSRFWLELKQG